ncbi:ALKB1 dioxygenase, partial [Amia calva]|nr:ALKB1 dioxygenase [Amia calva]
MAKMAASIVEHGEDAFRKLFKFYKRRNPPPDLSDVIDFSKGVRNGKVSFNDVFFYFSVFFFFSVALYCVNTLLLVFGSIFIYKLLFPSITQLSENKGFIFISNPFLSGSQQYWVKQCLKVYPRKPNICNLDLHMSAEETQNIWEKSTAQISQKRSGKREPKTLLEKLRWVTLGYHYNWETKTYSADQHTPFPSELHTVAQHVASACSFPDFTAEAGILNYYHFDSSLGIHVDESELDHTQPLLSFSFGQSAIFLLGGLRREDPATAMFMHSGDIMVMSGPSRLLYHAVPKIVTNPGADLVPQCLLQRSDVPEDSVVRRVSEQDWDVCTKYIQTSRINVTVRQVLGRGVAFPVGSADRSTAPSLNDAYHESSSEGEGGVDEKRMRSSSGDS